MIRKLDPRPEQGVSCAVGSRFEGYHVDAAGQTSGGVTADAIFFGAVGWPDTVPDHVSLHGSILQFRREFDQYINLRPVRLMSGIASPLVGREPGSIDFWIVRENTEGEYCAVGGHVFAGTDREVVIQESVMTRFGVDRVLRFAFEFANGRDAKHLTSATKSNGLVIARESGWAENGG